MTLRISLGLGAVMFAALTAVNCSPPLIRCETNDQCTSDMKCDVRQGLCVDEGEYIENPDGTPANPGGSGQDGSTASQVGTVTGNTACQPAGGTDR